MNWLHRGETWDFNNWKCTQYDDDDNDSNAKKAINANVLYTRIVYTYSRISFEEKGLLIVQTVDNYRNETRLVEIAIVGVKN